MVFTSYEDVSIFYASRELIIKFTEVTKYYDAKFEGSCNVDNFTV